MVILVIVTRTIDHMGIQSKPFSLDIITSDSKGYVGVAIFLFRTENFQRLHKFLLQILRLGVYTLLLHSCYTKKALLPLYVVSILPFYSLQLHQSFIAVFDYFCGLTRLNVCLFKCSISQTIYQWTTHCVRIEEIRLRTLS